MVLVPIEFAIENFPKILTAKVEWSWWLYM